MKFITGGKYHQVSDCGRYSICKVRVDGHTWLYEAWLRQPSTLLACRLSSAELAQQHCEQHATGLAVEPAP